MRLVLNSLAFPLRPPRLDSVINIRVTDQPLPSYTSARLLDVRAGQAMARV